MQTFKLILILSAFLLLCSCGEAPKAPVDADGKTPDAVLLSVYTDIVNGKLTVAEQRFSPGFIKAIITDNKSTFADYCKNTAGWQVSWLKTKVLGNEYNKDVWRVKIIPDEGKGAENKPGIVHDLAIIEGKWTIVFWGDYPKS